jgi:D-glycero-D-manno-heptose 1,7-bisphosphate phosphatase
MCESPLEEDAVRLIPGAAQALARLVDAGLVPVCVTNQPAAAKGTVTVEKLLAVHLRVVELLAGQGGVLAVSYLCLHHPQGVTPELAGACACRKPAPGMLLQAAGELDVELRDAWMVGDTDADVDAGRAAGCRTALIRYPGSFHKRALGSGADATFADVAEAAAALSSTKTN